MPNIVEEQAEYLASTVDNIRDKCIIKLYLIQVCDSVS